MADSNELIGQTIGNYKITAYIGGGGMSEGVFRATHLKLGNDVAIKIMDIGAGTTPDRRKRIVEEPRKTASLNHPNIVKVLDVIEEGPRLYMIMEFIEGRSLLQLILDNVKDPGTGKNKKKKTVSPFPKDLIASIIVQIGRALDYAHNHGIIHRDVKPSNILITDDGRAVLSDFGIAKAIEATELSFTHEGVGVGTPPYMSPEQIRGDDLTPASDEYSLAIVAYQMLTGQVPFEGTSSMVIAHKHLTEPPPSPRGINPNVSEKTERVLLKALSKNPKERFTRAGDFVSKIVESLDATSKIHLPKLSLKFRLQEGRGWGFLSRLWRGITGFLSWSIETLFRSLVYILIGTALFLILLIFGGSLILSRYVENQVADYNWRFNQMASDQKTLLTSDQIRDNFNHYMQLYLPGSIAFTKIETIPPNTVKINSVVFNYIYNIDLDLALNNGRPVISVTAVNQKKPLIFYNMIAGGINRGFKRALEKSSGSLSALDLQADGLSYMIGAPRITSDVDVPESLPAGAIIQDDFADLNSGWPRSYSVEAARVGYNNGKYRIDDLQPSFLVFQEFPKKIGEFQISIETSLQKGPKSTQYGLALLAQDQSNFVSVLVTGDGFAMIGLTTNNNTTQLLGWISIDDFAPGSNNTIKAVLQNNTVQLIINDQEIGTVIIPETYSGIEGGFVGLIVQTSMEGAATVDFDNLIIASIDE